MASSVIKIDDIVQKYMALRQKKEEIEREAKDKVAQLKATMEKLEAYLLQRMQAEGVDQYKTKYGTAFATTNDYASVADWEATLDYIIQSQAFDLLEKRVNKTAVRSLLENGQAVPPGVNYGTRIDVNIRKPPRQE